MFGKIVGRARRRQSDRQTDEMAAILTRRAGQRGQEKESERERERERGECTRSSRRWGNGVDADAARFSSWHESATGGFPLASEEGTTGSSGRCRRAGDTRTVQLVSRWPSSTRPCDGSGASYTSASTTSNPVAQQQATRADDGAGDDDDDGNEERRSVSLGGAASFCSVRSFICSPR